MARSTVERCGAGGELGRKSTAAVYSSRRLRGQRVYPDTLLFWIELLEMARNQRDTAFESDGPALADQLEHEIRHHRGQP